MVGRPKKNPEEKRVQKAVGLLPAEWNVLAMSDPDGSAAREAARVLRGEIARRMEKLWQKLPKDRLSDEELSLVRERFIGK